MRGLPREVFDHLNIVFLSVSPVQSRAECLVVCLNYLPKFSDFSGEERRETDDGVWMEKKTN